MRLAISILFAAATFAAAPVPAVLATDLALNCDRADIPEAWKRPGGFCDQESGSTLSSPGTACEFDALPVRLDLKLLEEGDRVHHAAIIDPCCPLVGSYEVDPETGVLVAQIDPCNPCSVEYRIEDQSADPRDRLILAGC